MGKELFDKIFGSLACIAIGDALGFPVHDMAKEEIKKRYGGLVNRMMPAFEDDFIHLDYKAGQVTDDTILTLLTADIILQTEGKPTIGRVVKSFSEWAQKNKNLWSLGEVFGDTTKGSLERMIKSTEKGFPWEVDLTRGYATVGSSNGAVMRIAPAGLVNPGLPKSACEIVFPLIIPTHRTDVALSAACGQSAAVSEALSDKASLRSIVDAAITGAKFGSEFGKENAYIVPSASVSRRVELAAELVEKSSDPWEAALMIGDYIGSYLPAAETLPAAVGIFYACEGDPKLTMEIAASIGGDTDTVASSAGAIAGAYSGISEVPMDWLGLIEEVNNLGLEDYATNLSQLAVKRVNK